VRVCKETGGVYFMLPGEEENLVGRPAAIEARKFHALAMKEYEPLLLSRRDYEEQRTRSKFRTGVWEVIKNLNPHWDAKLNMRSWHFAVEPEEFQKQGGQEFEKAAYAMNQLNKGIGLMDNIRPLRAKEDSQRWRAAYDLIYAQCLAYRVRLFQYLLVLDDHSASGRKPKDPKHNRWDIRNTKEYMEPTDPQFDRIKNAFKIKESRSEYLALLQSEMQKADEAFDAVVKEHAGTPWDARAKWDKGRRYGYRFDSMFWDPRYREVGKRIKVPKF
jgi:hypothetical protein